MTNAGILAQQRKACATRLARRCSFSAVIWRVAVLVGSVLGASAAAAAQAPELASETSRTAVIEGERYTYTAEASRIPIRHAETGEHRGSIFYVAYRLPPTDAATPRPVIFSWGGGPSGPALGMHMIYGPRTSTPDGRIVDNDLSLLTVADLVFVDPIGTGFSRATSSDYLDEFYSTTGDARSIAEFVRIWIARNRAEHEPIYLNGQSYGVWRAAIVGELLERSGRSIEGLILTSGGMGIAQEYSDPVYGHAYRVPDFAAAAFTHGRLEADLGQSPQEVWEMARAWAVEVYAPALARLDELNEGERESIAGELSRRTGFPLDRVDRGTLIIRAPEFLQHFLGPDGPRLSTFDMRPASGVGSEGHGDAETRARAAYLREELGYQTDLAYLGLEPGYLPVTEAEYRPIGTRWNYDSGNGDHAAAARVGQGPPGSEPWVLRTLEINPTLRIFVETAIYDSLNYCEADHDRIRRMPDVISARFEVHCYFAGHGSFRDPEAYPLVIRDIRNFVAAGRTAR